MTRDEFHTELMAARDLSATEHEQVFHSVRERLRGLDGTQQFEVLFPLAVKAQHDAPSSPAAELLRELSPVCSLTCEDAVRALLPEWDVSIREVPFYLAAQFGLERVRQAVNHLGPGIASDSEKRSLQTVAYWLDRYEEAYRNGS